MRGGGGGVLEVECIRIGCELNPAGPCRGEPGKRFSSPSSSELFHWLTVPSCMSSSRTAFPPLAAPFPPAGVSPPTSAKGLRKSPLFVDAAVTCMLSALSLEG